MCALYLIRILHLYRGGLDNTITREKIPFRDISIWQLGISTSVKGTGIVGVRMDNWQKYSVHYLIQEPLCQFRMQFLVSVVGPLGWLHHAALTFFADEFVGVWFLVVAIVHYLEKVIILLNYTKYAVKWHQSVRIKFILGGGLETQTLRTVTMHTLFLHILLLYDV